MDDKTRFLVSHGRAARGRHTSVTFNAKTSRPLKTERRTPPARKQLGELSNRSRRIHVVQLIAYTVPDLKASPVKSQQLARILWGRLGCLGLTGTTTCNFDATPH